MNVIKRTDRKLSYQIEAVEIGLKCKLLALRQAANDIFFETWVNAFKRGRNQLFCFTLAVIP